MRPQPTNCLNNNQRSETSDWRIPLQLALDCTENAIKNSTVELPLPTDDIMDLLNLCFTSTYFQYNGKRYKQLHGTAMGSLVSVAVAEIVM